MSNTQMPQPAPAPQPGPAAPARAGNGLATAGFILSLLGLLSSWIPVLNFLGIILGVLGAILAAIGLAKSKKVGAGKGLAIAGLVMGGLAVIIAIIVNVAFVNAVDDAIDDATKPSTSAQAVPTADISESSPDAETSSEAPENESSFVDGVLTTPDVRIAITDHKVIPVGKKGNEYGDKPVIAFWYEITNVSGKDVDPTEWIFLISAYQDNNPNAVNELDVAALPDDSFLDSQTETIKKGGTVESAVAYELDDEVTAVDLVASDSFGFSDDIGKMTYSLK